MTLTDSLSPEVKYIFQPLEDSFEKLRSAFVFQETQSKITCQRLVDLVNIKIKLQSIIIWSQKNLDLKIF